MIHALSRNGRKLIAKNDRDEEGVDGIGGGSRFQSRRSGFSIRPIAKGKAMNREQRIEFYKEMYFFELERREKILGRLSIPLTGIAAVAGLLAFMLNDPAPISSAWRMPFQCLFAGAIIALVAAATFVQRVAWSFRKTCFVATPHEMEVYLGGLRKSYPSGTADDEAKISETFAGYRLKTFCRAATFNAAQNDPLSRRQFYAGIFLTLAIVLALSATVTFYIGRVPTGESKDDGTKSTGATAATTTATTGTFH